jgi:sec-independent protein translocase protein TatB
VFGISFSEIILIVVLTVIIFGPEQLPQYAHKLGKLVATFQRWRYNLSQQLTTQIGLEDIQRLKDQVENTVWQLKQQLRQPTLDIDDNFSDTSDNYMHHEFLYQPELEFNRQPELFDEDNQ